MAGERYRLACERCDWVAETAGPHDDGAGGTTARLYCPTCGATRDCDLSAGGRRRGNAGPFGVPLGPRDGPAGRLAGALARRLRGQDTSAPGGAIPACPSCGGHDFVLAPVAGAVLPCPCCGTGRLVISCILS